MNGLLFGMAGNLYWFTHMLRGGSRQLLYRGRPCGGTVRS